MEFCIKNEKEKLNRIANTWNLKIPYSSPPKIKDGNREVIRKRDDWEEESNSFGMVKIEISITSSEISKYNLFEISELVIEISILTIPKLLDSSSDRPFF